MRYIIAVYRFATRTYADILGGLTQRDYAGFAQCKWVAISLAADHEGQRIVDGDDSLKALRDRLLVAGMIEDIVFDFGPARWQQRSLSQLPP